MPGSLDTSSLASRLEQMGQEQARMTTVLEQHLKTCDRRAATNERTLRKIRGDAEAVRLALNEEKDRNDRFKETTLTNQSAVLAALRISPDGTPLAKSTMGTLPRPSPWTIAGALATALLALPLAAKIVDAAWEAIVHLLLK